MTNFFYRWTFDLVGNCLPEYRKNGQRIYPVNNALLINDEAGEQIFKIIISCAVRNLKVWKDNLVVFDQGNMEERDVTVGTSECEEYTPADGEACRTGYDGAGGTFRIFTWKWKYSGGRWFTGSTATVDPDDVFRVFRSGWPNYITLDPRLSTTITEGRVIIETTSVIPPCVPNDQCEGEPITEQQEVWNSLPLEYSDTIGAAVIPPAEVPEEQPEEVPGNVNIPGQSQIPVAPVDAAANDNYIIALVEAAKRSGRAVTFGPEGLSSITRQDSKYRIVSPESFSLVMGKWVPDIRYESVRYLSPAAASNFIGRGYELATVTPDTPESTSKPYSQSVIKRQQLLTGKKGIYNKRITRGRITIGQAAYGQKPQQSANINKIRGYYRRRIIR